MAMLCMSKSNGVVVKDEENPDIASMQGEEKPDGWWLSDPGEYRDYIGALCGSNPGLLKQDPNNDTRDEKVKKESEEISGLANRTARVVLLERSSGTAVDFEREDFQDADELRQHFRSKSPPNHNSHRIYIMEGLNTKFVSVVGGHFFMDPTFFQRQERTCVWSNEFTPVSDALPQPSLLDPDKMFHLQYCELRQFNKAVESKAFFCQSTRRHVGMTPPRHREDSTTGILRRKVGWWCRNTEGGGWDVVILCDPQLKTLNASPKVYDLATKEYVKLADPNILENKPFQGGYIDFIPSRSPSEARARARAVQTHEHKSMLEDLVHYFRNHSDLLEDWSSPKNSSIFVQKIVAAHYLQLVDYVKAMLPSLELRLTTAWVEEQEQWKSLQTISRRCGNYCDDIEDTLLSLDFPLEISRRKSRDWKDSQIDFQYIYFRLKVLKERADTLMSSMTGLASIAGNRQNLEEAKRVKRLNLLALLFIPLAYTSSLFSMQDDFAPGNGKFWLYWVSALSVVAVTLLVTWVLDSALNDAAQWVVPFSKILGGRGATTLAEFGLAKKSTGFYQERNKHSH